MPRGDGTGPWGNGPLGRGRGGGCLGFGFNNGPGRSIPNFSGSAANNQATLEDQAARLEEQAANLRNLARQNRKND
ncbi:MAG: hypothetical protein K0R55_652 [Sporomusa sp.]|jgi:hypothetical protein|nr:hypothetical protein [Sporomusa sp.]